MPGSPDTGAREPQPNAEALARRIKIALDLGLQAWRSTPSRSRFHEAFDALNALLAAGVGEARPAEPRRAMDLDSTPVGAREGIAMVYDSHGRYLGCLGIETWLRLLSERPDHSVSAPTESPAEPPTDRYEEALRWIAVGKTGSYGTAQAFAAAVLTEVGAPAEEQPDAREDLARIRALVDEQAEDEGLWGIHPSGRQPIVEAYLQQELRRLHAAVEASGASAPLAALTKERDGLREQLDALAKAADEYQQAAALAGSYPGHEEFVGSEFVEIHGRLDEADLALADRIAAARAALGDVAAGGYAADGSTSHKSDEGGALGQKASETRADADKEAL